MGIPKAEVKFMMRRGVVGLITVIPHDELDKGVAFIRTQTINYFVELHECDAELELHPVSFGTSLGTFIFACEWSISFDLLFAHRAEIIGSHLFMLHINISLSDTGCGRSWSKF